MTHRSLPFLRHPLQLLIKCKDKPLGTFRFNAQNTVHYVEAAVGIELQGADKLVTIAIDDPPVAQKRHELFGRFGAGNFVEFCEDVDAFDDDAFQDNGPIGADMNLLEQGGGGLELGGNVAQKVTEHDVCIREYGHRPTFSLTALFHADLRASS